MRTRTRWSGAGLAYALLAGCSQPEAPPVSKIEKRVASPPNITQFYASPPEVEKGGRTLLCYGVENAKTVWLAPPRQELTASHTRCVEAFPSATTKYTLTAEGDVGPAATKEVTVSVGPPAPPRAQIVEVTISALSVRPGEPVSICYEVKNAASVSIEPIQYRGGPQSKGCTLVQPRETTTYTVTARGARNEDSERVTVKVQ